MNFMLVTDTYSNLNDFDRIQLKNYTVRMRRDRIKSVANKELPPLALNLLEFSFCLLCPTQVCDLGNVRDSVDVVRRMSGLEVYMAGE